MPEKPSRSPRSYPSRAARLRRGVVRKALAGLRMALETVRSYEPHMLGVFIILAGALWGFVEITDEVLEGTTASLDEKILLALRSPVDAADPLGPLWFEEMARDITAFGGIGVLALFTALAAGFLVLQRKRRTAIYLLVATGGGIVVSILLKAGFDRPRPDLVPHGQAVYTSSFPSGHSMLSAVTLLTIGALLASAQPNLRLKIYLLSVAVLLTLLVGFSRVYLGVHWPTDVLAGWTAGAAWALLCWVGAEHLGHREAADPAIRDESPSASRPDVSNTHAEDETAS
jgi:undecaprenyl-diphosphatase